MPALDALVQRFAACNTQVLAVSVDSRFSHANFGASLGGISYPMLADFHPKGSVGTAMGVHIAEMGFNARATIIIDADGKIHHASVGTKQRDMDVIAALCEKMNADHKGDLPSANKAAGMAEATLYVRSRCGASLAAQLAQQNLHVSTITVKNVSDDASAMSELKDKSGAETAPVLVVGDKVISEAAKIVEAIVASSSAL